MNQRVEADRDLMRQRMLGRTPFRYDQAYDGGGRFLTRNLKGTKTEMALSVIAYNLLRRINIQAAAS